VTVLGNYAYVVQRYQGLQIIDHLRPSGAQVGRELRPSLTMQGRLS